jgi:YfiR/HmsC-like
MIRQLGLAAVALLAQTASSSHEVPLDVQVPAMLKALAYDRNLVVTERGVVVGIVFDSLDSDSKSVKDRVLAIHKELTRLRVKGERVTFVPIAYPTERALSESGAQALLVAPLSSTSMRALVEQSRAERMLTIATVPEDVKSGLSLGMELEGGRPRLLVNLASLTVVGASFESSFLNLCRIVEP